MSYAHALPGRLRGLAAVALIALLTVLAVGLLSGPADAKPGKKPAHANPGKGKVVNVMTRNIYLGANLIPAVNAPDVPSLVEAAGGILREEAANRFDIRVEGLAAEILRKKPDLVGLQEVALWRTGPPSLAPLQVGPSATTVRRDYLRMLLEELNEDRKRYRVVVVQTEADIEAPANENDVAGDGPAGIPNAEINGRLTMRDVILARHGAGVVTRNSAGGHFETIIVAPTAGGALPVLRGWTSTDAKVRGSKPFRFVNTHLEAFEPNVRAAQAVELVDGDGPATSALPVVLLGDLNSDDDTVFGDDRLAYQALQGAGMVNRSTDDPLSCCLNSSLLAVGSGGDVSDFDHQVDHVLTRDPATVGLLDSSVTGLLPVNGFWSSDHAGVFSSLRFIR